MPKPPKATSSKPTKKAAKSASKAAATELAKDSERSSPATQLGNVRSKGVRTKLAKSSTRERDATQLAKSSAAATSPARAGAAAAAARSVKATKLAKAGAAHGANVINPAKAPAAAAAARSVKATKLAKAGGAASKPARADRATPPPADDLPILPFETAADWKRWLERQHQTARGLWLKLARKGSGIASVDRTQAVDGALCYGWIDGQGRSFDQHYYLIKFTPRGARSVWSKINRVKVQALIEQGLMKPAGLAEVERAQRDGRWDAAYDSPRTASVPDDLVAALNAHPRARASFAELNAANRYAILWQLQTAKKAETRARRISRFIDTLERGETLH